jgi:hypothetical protein
MLAVTHFSVACCSLLQCACSLLCSPTTLRRPPPLPRASCSAKAALGSSLTDVQVEGRCHKSDVYIPGVTAYSACKIVRQNCWLVPLNTTGACER